MASNERTSTAGAKVEVTEKMVMIHTFFVLGVCVVFGAINIIAGSVGIGLAIILIGGAAVGVTMLMKNSPKFDNVMRGTVLSRPSCCLLLQLQF